MRRFLLIAALAIRSCTPEPVFANTMEECYGPAELARKIYYVKEQHFPIDLFKQTMTADHLKLGWSSDEVEVLMDFIDRVWGMNGGHDYVAEKIFNLCSGTIPA